MSLNRLLLGKEMTNETNDLSRLFSMRKRNTWSVMLLAMSFSLPAGAANADLTALPLEQLLSLEVISASKFNQKVSEAPATVTVITAEEIRTYGHRTLADILRSIPGLYVTSDHSYSYLGARGFQPPGDYNTRILLLVDGFRLNDSIYGQAYVGTEFILDPDLIERVEYVAGPGSSLYGSNAFFGVINVITRSKQNGTEVAATLGDYATRKGRVSIGKTLDNGSDLVLSATQEESAGQGFYFPEFDQPGNNNGKANNLNRDRSSKFFAKLSQQDLTLEMAWMRRNKQNPGAPYGTVFGQPVITSDEQAFMALDYRHALSDVTRLDSRVFYGENRYQGDYSYDASPNRDLSTGKWWGGELRLTSAAIKRHKIVAGLEYQKDLRQDQRNFDVAPYLSYVDDRRNGWRTGVFVQGEYTLRDDLLFSLGLRHDRNNTQGGATHPRLAAIWHPQPDDTVRLLYGSAYRTPNVYEMFYTTEVPGGQFKGNPDLHSETIQTYELALERAVSPAFKLSASLYHYHIDDLIQQVMDPADGKQVFLNAGTTTGQGLELGGQGMWRNGVKSRFSVAFQRTKDRDGKALVNSPSFIAKLNVSLPLAYGLRLGTEAQYLGARQTMLDGTAGGYLLANLTLGAEKLTRNLDVYASIYNLLDRRFSDPVGGDFTQVVLIQDARSFRVKAVYHF